MSACASTLQPLYVKAVLMRFYIIIISDKLITEWDLVRLELWTVYLVNYEHELIHFSQNLELLVAEEELAPHC